MCVCVWCTCVCTRVYVCVRLCMHVLGRLGFCTSSVCIYAIIHTCLTHLSLVNDTSVTCQSLVNDMLVTCQSLVNDTSMTCQSLVNDMLVTCQSLVNDTSMTCQSLVNDMLVTCQSHEACHALHLTVIILDHNACASAPETDEARLLLVRH